MSVSSLPSSSNRYHTVISDPQNSGAKIAGKIAENTESRQGLPQTHASMHNSPPNALKAKSLVAEQSSPPVVPLREEQREALTQKLAEFVKENSKGLSFRLDEDSGRYIVTIYELSSGEIIKQIPEKDMLEILKKLSSKTSGFVSQKV
ncbi:MAG: flagellar protein FlaG [Vibrionaceae bacterium]